MPYVVDPTDPFAGGEKIPSLSWKGLPIGSYFSLEITEAPKAIQSTNFETRKPAFWDDDPNRPKMAAVVNVRVLNGPHSVGEERSIWAQVPSNIWKAIQEAQKTAGARLAPGGILHVKFAGEIPHENKHYSPIKQYEARYEPPVSTGPDPFAQPTQPAQPAQPTQPAYAAQPAQPAAPLPGMQTYASTATVAANSAPGVRWTQP